MSSNDWVVTVAAGLVLLVLVGLAVRLLRRPATMSQTLDTGEPSSNVQVGIDPHGDLTAGGISHTDRKSFANYLLAQIRDEGLMPGSTAERTAESEARLAFQDREAKFLLAKAVDELPERERVVLALQFYDGLPAAELAKLLGVSSSTVYRLRRNALSRLARTIGPTSGDA